jgi:hypothetical protein
MSIKKFTIIYVRRTTWHCSCLKEKKEIIPIKRREKRASNKHLYTNFTKNINWELIIEEEKRKRDLRIK